MPTEHLFWVVPVRGCGPSWRRASYAVTDATQPSCDGALMGHRCDAKEGTGSGEPTQPGRDEEGPEKLPKRGCI